MKSIFKHFLLIVKSLFASISNAITSYFKSLRSFWATNKKGNTISAIALFATSIFVVSSALLACEFLPNNKSITLAEISRDFENEVGSKPRGLIYGHQLVTSYHELIYMDPEKSKEMRNILYEDTIFDLYPANWLQKYSPGVVDYIDKSDVNVSFLLWPKDSYVHKYFKYPMPLLAGSISNLSTPQDIFINSKFADKLIAQDGSISPYDYSGLIGKNKPTQIKYKWQDNSTNTDVFTPVDYYIKGVIDFNSDQYQQYYKLFGDFFLVNEYFSLPLPSATYFTFNGGQFNDWKYFDIALNIFHYESVRKSSDTITSLYAYEYRLTFFGDSATEYAFTSVSNRTSKYFSMTSEVFAPFADYSASIYFVVFLLTNLIIYVVFFILATSMYKSYMKSYNKKNTTIKPRNIILIIVILLPFPIFLGLSLAGLISTANSILSILSPWNFWGLILFTVEIAFLVLYISFLKCSYVPLRGERT